MKRVILAAVVAATFLPASLALACGKDCGCKHDKMAMNEESGAKADFKMVTVAEVAKLTQAKQATIFDANTTELRQKEGVVPGAKLLSSASDYDVKKELPAQKDQKLVFYCASTKCLASHMAAERAVGAGYTDVSVMPDGIKGWKAAGEKTQPVNKS